MKKPAIRYSRWPYSCYPRMRKHGICVTISTLCLAFLTQSAVAETSCAFNGVVSVNFGKYAVFSLAANNNGVGSLSVHCQGGGSPTYSIMLGAGQSQSYLSRVMESGGNVLNYNLYTNATRVHVWGDGTGGSRVIAVVRNSHTTLSIFGQIPAGQDVRTGVYTDSIIATINF